MRQCNSEGTPISEQEDSWKTLPANATLQSIKRFGVILFERHASLRYKAALLISGDEILPTYPIAIKVGEQEQSIAL